jgi:hypothetical protein
LSKNSTKYGHSHRKLRARLDREVKAGRASCWRCGRALDPDERWHLGHHDDGSHAGQECVTCNLRDGGRKRAAQLYGRRVTGAAPSEDFSRYSTWDAQPAGGTAWSRHWYGAGHVHGCPDCDRLGAACEVGRKIEADEHGNSC